MRNRQESRVRVLVAFGTRPEAIKLWPVIRELTRADSIEVTTVCTGQHRELVDSVLNPLGFRPDLDLEITRIDHGLNELISVLIPMVEEVIQRIEPELVVVQGDTTCAVATAMAAFHLGTEIAHVEAGLRSGDRNNPFPEETNRRILGCLGDLHLAPTARAAKNLLREGAPASEVFVTGNTGIDALLQVLADPEPAEMPSGLGKMGESRPILVTLHRRESWMSLDDQTQSSSVLEGLLDALCQSAQSHPELLFIYPVHPNPRVRELAYQHLREPSNLRLVDPLDYRCFVNVMAKSRLVITDSGGIQEEAPSLGVPALILRRTTERGEALGISSNRLVGVDPDAVTTAIETELSQPPPVTEGRPFPSPFGDGRAAMRIRQVILHHFGQGSRPEPFQAPLESRARVSSQGESR